MSKMSNGAASPERTILSLSITTEDKRKLKMLAAQRDTTIAAIIHAWVEKHCDDREDEAK